MGFVNKLAPKTGARKMLAKGKCCGGLHCTCKLTCSCDCKHCTCGEFKGA